MKIWLADFHFETTLGGKKPLIKVVHDVVVVRLPDSHIHRKSDYFDRATRSLFEGEKKLLAKDKLGRYKATIKYKKIIGQTQYGREMDQAY